MQGKIIKGIAGFYYVHVPESGVYECKARGNFRNQKIKPLVGDDVELVSLDEEKMLGNITRILPRTSALIRPAVANVDQAVVVFAAAEPDPNLNLLDRFLVSMECQQVPTVICFNKNDLVTEEQRDRLKSIYQSCGYPVYCISVKEKEGLEEVRSLLKGRTTVLAGPSGVGKSSFTNYLIPDAEMETGQVSEKIKRGRHTTRHSEFFFLGDDSYLLDTPGFSSLTVEGLEKEEVWKYFPEFAEHEPYCKFQGCVHIGEKVCGVKDAVARGEIAESRYRNYQLIYEEIKQQKKY